jgi:hypothetical protein
VSFTIVRTNGTVLAVIPDGDLNSNSSPLFLPGRNYPGYGSVIDTNFVRTLENYAFTAPPQNALQGQLWFNTNNNSLCVCPVDNEDDPNNWIRLVTNDSTLDITVANVYADQIFANGATFADTVTANLFEADYITVNVQANIGNLDVSGTTTLDSLTTANITTGSNTTPGNLTGAWSLDGTLTSNGNVTALGFKSDNYRYANGQSINFDAAAGNTGEIQFNTSGSLNSSPDFTFTAGNSSLSVAGNITAANFNVTSGGIYTGNGSGLSAIAAANLTGTLSSAIQSNITQLGTLASLTATGNINTANLFATTVNATSLIGTLGTAAQPNITSVGTLTSLDVTGNVTSGNADLGNLVTANFVTGTLTTAAQPNITSVGTLSSLAVTANITAGNIYANSGRIGATLLTGTLTTAAQANITSVGTLSYLNVTGPVNVDSLSSNTLSGDGSNIYNITGSEVTGEVDFAAVANSVNVANVADIGNIALLDLDGNASNVLYGNGVFASVAGAGGDYSNSNVVSLLSSFGSNVVSTTGNVTAGNVYANSGTLGASLLAGTLTTAAQPNVTSVGTLTSAAVTGNVTAGNVYANSGTVRGSLLTGTITTAAQPNITSLGTLVSLIVSGNINAANVSGNHFGNGAGLSNINASNISGAVANASYATTAGSISSIPSGTKMLFAQTSAPTGWTKITSNDDAALRVVSGTASSGGTVGFTTAFAAKTVSGTTGSTSLSEAQIPSHYHLAATNIKVSSGNVSPFGSSTYLARETDIGGDTEYNLQATSSAPDSLRTSSVGSGSGHDHTFSGSLNLAVKYVDVIVAQKD